MTATLHPAAFSGYEVRLQPFAGSSRHGEVAHAVYVRRRLLVALLFLALCGITAALVRTVLVDRGGVPASAPAIHPAQSLVAGTPVAPAAPTVAIEPAAAVATPIEPAVAAADAIYVVRAGDTVWSIAQQFHGDSGVGDFVDLLIESNGGTALQIGQALILP